MSTPVKVLQQLDGHDSAEAKIHSTLIPKQLNITAYVHPKRNHSLSTSWLAALNVSSQL